MPTRASTQKRSIFASIIIPLIILLLIEITVFASIMGMSGVFSRLNQSNQDILSQQVISRKDNLEYYLVGTVSNLESLAAEINSATQAKLDAGELHLDTLDVGAGETKTLVSDAMRSLVSTMRAKRTNGIFIIFNTHDLSGAYAGGALGKKPGVYIRDMDPTATPSSRNEDLVIQCGTTEVVETSSITSDNAWKPMFDFSNADDASAFDYFYLPWQTAYETEGPKEASDFAYWGTSPLLGTGAGPNMTYTIPLILDDGTVYGVLGVDLATTYLRTLLPYTELSGEGAQGTYILGTVEEEELQNMGSPAQVHPVVVHTGSLHDVGETMSVTALGNDEYSFDCDGETHFASGKVFRLYNTNAPFEHINWVLFGTLPEASLHRFSNQVLLMMALASLLMLAAGVAGSVFIGRSISNPVKSLARDVETAQIHKAEMPELAATGISEVDSLTGAIMSLSKDIASVKQLEQQRIEHERDYDLLTGLMNRRALYREAGKIFSSPDVLKHAAFILLDLDNLKELNDTYGHDWGDKYIYQAARCFEESVSPDVLVARVAGDEFFMVFYGYETREALEEDIVALRNAIPAKSIMLPGGEMTHVSASGGAAFYPEDGKEFTELMKLADFAMYQVKIAGKNNIGFFDIDNYQEQSSVRRALAELNDLLANNELSEYHFQPIVDGRTGRVFAYEALMRVALESLRSPDDVLTLARQEGRMAEVELLTWTRSFECFGQLQERGEVDAQAKLFINSFANIVIDADDLDALVLQYPDIIERLVIEITEAENMNEDALAAKRAIKGFSGLFALDDYGSGYNSEIMLLDLKPAFVKVDISIIRDIDTSIDKQRIVENVVEYAHERNMFIVAEGVETAEELLTLLDLGVDYLQGFFLARPARMPGNINEAALAIIKEHA